MRCTYIYAVGEGGYIPMCNVHSTYHDMSWGEIIENFYYYLGGVTTDSF